MKFVFFFLIHWFNTTVDIPVYESLEPYKSQPYAVLETEEGDLSGRLMYYEYEVDHTTFSTVNTNKVGQYKVSYKVYYPIKNISSVQSITFNVYDDIKPEVIHLEKIKVPLKGKLPNALDYIMAKDNYSGQLSIKTIGYDLIKTDKIGTFNFTYEIVDESFNKTTITNMVEIYDDIKPNITLKKAVVLNLNEEINIYDFFDLSDNYDAVLSIEHNIKTSALGKYKGHLKVMDQSFNQAWVEFDYEIKDSLPPQIVLQKDSLTINLNDYEKLFKALEENILSITDDSEFSHQIIYEDIKKVGKHFVTYYAKDIYNNETTKKISYEIIDNEPPTYELIKPLTLEVNDLEPLVETYIKVYDNDQNKVTIKQTGKVNMAKPGINRIIIELTDDSKNLTTFPLIFTVIDSKPPKVKLKSEIVVTDFKKPQYETYLEITDNYDKTFDIEIIEDIDYEKIGLKSVILSIKDQSGNETILECKVLIKDLTTPQIKLKTKEVFIFHPNRIENFYDYIESVEDLYDTNLKIEDVKVINYVNFNVIGRYEVEYRLEDPSGNQTRETLIIYIKDITPPILTIQEKLNFKANEIPSLYTLASAYDAYDKDITHLITVSPSNIEKPGIYEVLFEVQDHSGNYTSKKVNITILENNETKKNYFYIAIWFTVIVVILYTIRHKKRTKHFDKTEDINYNV